ncbi:peptidase, M20/M25/M40 family [Cooperia oncophora]
MTIHGSEPELPSIVLYSHMDVVPTSKDKWTYPPYSGHKDKNGYIYGRGAQDMKCVGSQYIEAIRRHFSADKRQWRRTIHLVYGSEEENGSVDGMAAFVKTREFKDLNVGFWLDEGQASETAVYKVFYAEKNQWCKLDQQLYPLSPRLYGNYS